MTPLSTAPQEDGPAKKKPKRVEKPLPEYLQGLDSLNLEDYTLTTEKKMIKNSEGDDEEVEVACTIAKDNNETHLDKDLSAYQLRRLGRKIGITKASLTKTEIRFHILKASRNQSSINKTLEQIPSTQCRIINVLFHRDFIDDFMAFNDSRSRDVQESGSGAQYQRFWKEVVDAVNGADSSPAKKAVEATSIFTQRLVDDNDDIIDEEVEAAIESSDKYGKLEKRDESDAVNAAYNHHVLDAILSRVDPSIKNTYKVNEKEVSDLFKALLNVRKNIQRAMNASGSHSSDPWDFTRQALSKVKGPSMTQFVAFYFFSKSEAVPEFATKFTTALAPSLTIDSADIPLSSSKVWSRPSSQASSRATTPVSMSTAQTDDKIASAISSATDVMADNAKKRETRMERAALLNEFSTLTVALSKTDNEEMKMRLQTRIDEVVKDLGL